MVNLLSREAILSSPIATKEIEVPEWGGSVRIRALSAKSRILLLDAVYMNEQAHSAWKEDQAKPEAEREGIERVDLYDQAILSVIFGIVDDNNELLFGLADYSTFTELGYMTIVALWGAIRDLCARSADRKKKFRLNPERRFLFRLAQSLGKTVEELETGCSAPLSARELEEWEAFHYFEPWGAPADDDRWRIHFQLQWYAGFKGDCPDFLDRDPEETARLRAMADAALTLEDKLMAFFEPRAIEGDQETDPVA